jgi:hypothetical protein
MRNLGLLVLGLGVAGAVAAEQLDIGHLETTDDVGVNWQYWACDRSGNTLHCHIVQSLLNHEIEPAERERQIQEKVRATTVDVFRRKAGEMCANVGSVRTAIGQMLARGRQADGTLISKQQSSDMRAYIDLTETACKDTNTTTIRRKIEQEVDQSIRTCTVFNIHSEDTLHWNERLHEWESRSGATGPCGEVTETRLRHDPSAVTFWVQEERHLYTSRAGVLPDGRSCAIFPAEKTYHFTWRAAENAIDCTYVKNKM